MGHTTGGLQAAGAASMAYGLFVQNYDNGYGPIPAAKSGQWSQVLTQASPASFLMPNSPGAGVSTAKKASIALGAGLLVGGTLLKKLWPGAHRMKIKIGRGHLALA